MKDKKIWIRVLLSPIIFIWLLLIIAAGSVLGFPFVFIVLFSFVALLLQPFIWLLNKGGANIKGFEPFVDDRGVVLGHFLGLTVHIWFAFYFTYLYIKNGTVIK